MTISSTDQNEFHIRNTKLEELDEYINILERAAEWMESQNLKQWIPGTFRQSEARNHISSAIAKKTSFVVVHNNISSGNGDNADNTTTITSASQKIAAIFAVNYEDPFDEMLWVPLLGPDHWKDAIYVHRLVVEKEFQGRGIVPKILKFVEELVPKMGKRYLRLDCRGNNPGLRKFYREKCRGRVVVCSRNEKEMEEEAKVMGLPERGTYTNPATGINYARFELLVCP